MGFFKKLTKLGLDVVTTPISVAKDVVTLGGVLTDKSELYTKSKLDRLAEDLEEVRDSLDD